MPSRRGFGGAAGKAPLGGTRPAPPQRGRWHCHSCPQLSPCGVGPTAPRGDPCGVCRGGTAPKRGRAVFGLWRSLGVSQRWQQPLVPITGTSGEVGDITPANPPRWQRRDPAVTSARTPRPARTGKLRHGASPRTPRGQSPAPPRAVPFVPSPPRDTRDSHHQPPLAAPVPSPPSLEREFR